MPDEAWTGLPPLGLADDRPVDDPPRLRLGGILAAVAASAGLAWLAAAPNPAADISAAPPQNPAPVPPPPAPLRYAAVQPDPDQVRQALNEAKEAYAEGGADGLVQASAACAKDLAADPRRLDYCLAYDLYAAAIVPPGSGPQADWFADGRDRDLALARSALPQSVDAADRLAQVGALSEAVLRKPATKAGKAAPLAQKLVKTRAVRPKAAKPKTHRFEPKVPWYPPAPSTLDDQYAREVAAQAELDQMFSQDLIDPPH